MLGGGRPGAETGGGRPPGTRRDRAGIGRVAWWLAVLEDGQDVTRRIGEPGDERAAAPVDALGVLFHSLIALEAHASAGQLIDGRVDVVAPEVAEGEVRRAGLGLALNPLSPPPPPPPPSLPHS